MNFIKNEVFPYLFNVWIRRKTKAKTWHFKITLILRGISIVLLLE